MNGGLLVVGGWGWLEVGLFPAQAFVSGSMGEERRAGAGFAHVPLLGGFVEADVRGPDDLESSERTKIDRFGVEAVDAAAGVEAKGAFHPSPSCWWFW
jgi:hypothetical protein